MYNLGHSSMCVYQFAYLKQIQPKVAVILSEVLGEEAQRRLRKRIHKDAKTVSENSDFVNQSARRPRTVRMIFLKQDQVIKLKCHLTLENGSLSQGTIRIDWIGVYREKIDQIGVHRETIDIDIALNVCFCKEQIRKNINVIYW